MHELAITQSVIEMITERIPGEQVIVVRLEIGKLAGIVPDAVAFCFELAAQGTNVEGAALEITQPPGTFRCRTCGKQFEHDDLIALCPCGSADLTVLSGQELRITSVEVV